LVGLTALEVAVWGVPHAAGSTFDVQRVEVRASGGVPALDGVLERRGGADVLVTHDGRAHAIPHLPDGLRGMVGARVWLAGPLDRPPDSFGIIAPPPGGAPRTGDTLVFTR
ncbi:MAG TPA: hypothetical protein VFH27_06615, partial [Longimicrobiaceae bacterium]|nr:hypothetical protein [Longimicrobiaceae bacterium]